MIEVTDVLTESILNIPDSVFKGIHEATRDTSMHTDPFPWTILSIVLATVSAIVGGWTLRSQWKTQKNTSRISVKSLFVDYTRHFYVDFVVLNAINVRMSGRYDEVYPAEEHLLKLRVPLENIYLDSFFKDERSFKGLQRFYMVCNNFNTEIEVAVKHMTSPDVPTAVKVRDMRTLMFKCGYLADFVVCLVRELWGMDCVDEIRELIRAYANMRNDLGRNGGSKPVYYAGTESLFFRNIFNTPQLADEFRGMLNKNIHTELGVNEENGYKIYVIPFTRR